MQNYQHFLKDFIKISEKTKEEIPEECHEYIDLLVKNSVDKFTNYDLKGNVGIIQRIIYNCYINPNFSSAIVLKNNDQIRSYQALISNQIVIVPKIIKKDVKAYQNVFGSVTFDNGSKIHLIREDYPEQIRGISFNMCLYVENISEEYLINLKIATSKSIGELIKNS